MYRDEEYYAQQRREREAYDEWRERQNRPASYYAESRYDVRYGGGYSYRNTSYITDYRDRI